MSRVMSRIMSRVYHLTRYRSTTEREQKNEINRLKLYIDRLEKRGNPDDAIVMEINALRKVSLAELLGYNVTLV